MRREAQKYLYDIAEACHAISNFTVGLEFDHYDSSLLVRSAVERQFEIFGEALSQLHRVDPQVAELIPEYQRIIAFRNILIHGYATIRNHTVWGVVEGDLPALSDQVEELLSQSE